MSIFARKLPIHLEANGSRVWMACRMRGDIHRRAETIPGQGFATSKRARAWAKEALGTPNLPPGVWTFPLNLRTCRDLRTEFDRDCEIKIHPGLWSWAAEEKAKRDDLRRIARSQEQPTPILDKVYPELAEAVHNRPFQSVGIEFARRARRSINADQPGLGKTLQAGATAVELELGGPILVLAPSAASAVTWPDEFDTWLPDEPYMVVDGDKGKRAKQLAEFEEMAKRYPRSWCFVNFEALQLDRWGVAWMELEPDPEEEDDYPLWDDEAERFKVKVDRKTGKPLIVRTTQRSDDPRFPALFQTAWSGAIVDEAHRILPTKSSEARKQSMIRAGAGRLQIRPDGLKMALSGTPMKGNPLNLWGILNWLAPEQYSSYWAFVNRWFDVVDEEIGDDVVKDVVGLRSTAAEEFGEEIDAVMIRRTKAEVAPQLPAKVYAGTRLNPKEKHSPVGIWLDMVPRQAKAYQQMVDDAVSQLESGQLMATGVLAEMTRCKQMASAFGDVEHVLQRVPGTSVEEWVDKFSPRLPSNKWDWIEEFLHERGIWRPKEAWGDNKIVIASWQTNLLKLFRAQTEKYKIPSLILTGEQNTAARRAAKSTFQAKGGPRLFFLNTLAGGVSLTLDAADDMVICDETWIPDEQEQVEDRIHRISRTGDRPPATYWYLRSRGTIEEHIAMVNVDKDTIQKTLMDGRRGVSFAKRLLTGG